MNMKASDYKTESNYPLTGKELLNGGTPYFVGGSRQSELRSVAGTDITVPDLICFSHLRWDFVYQRPQHLLSRAAKNRRVFVIEEPVYDPGSLRLEVRQTNDEVFVAVPHLPDGLQSEVAIDAVLRGMVDHLISEQEIGEYIAWYYTPMALSFTDHLRPVATIYDCMDELSAFKGASPRLRVLEQELFQRADLVFTGGHGLFEVKRNQHKAVRAFPSAIDRQHFAQAQSPLPQPEDQEKIPQPRLGFFGVIDERFDIELLQAIAAARPEWQFVMIGPVVKIDPAILPQLPNIHYLGKKSYQELPAYLAGWDVALLLFARNESTRFISPTKTPEYLAAGKPVVSTSIQDVVHPYGDRNLVKIADRPEDFVRAIEELLAQGDEELFRWRSDVEEFLRTISWDDTWSEMSRLIDNIALSRKAAVTARGQRMARTRAVELSGRP